MLRRDFIKSAGLTIGGVLVLNNLSFAENLLGPKTESSPKPRVYHFHGHARSGCATRPELAPFLEKGFCMMPPL